MIGEKKDKETLKAKEMREGGNGSVGVLEYCCPVPTIPVWAPAQQGLPDGGWLICNLQAQAPFDPD